MSITDELREFVESHLYLGAIALGGWKEAALDMIDRIDAELEGYIELPKDADGAPIRLGDRVSEDEFKPDGGTVVGIKHYAGWDHWLINCGAWVDPRKCRHVQPDSWERIITDALNAEWGEGKVPDLVERCKRLAGEGA